MSLSLALCVCVCETNRFNLFQLICEQKLIANDFMLFDMRRLRRRRQTAVAAEIIFLSRLTTIGVTTKSLENAQLGIMRANLRLGDVEM